MGVAPWDMVCELFKLFWGTPRHSIRHEPPCEQHFSGIVTMNDFYT